MNKKLSKKQQSGMASLLVAMIILSLGLIIVLALVFLMKHQQKISINISRSEQAYFAAEAGIEDALLRLRAGLNTPNVYNLVVATSAATVNVSDQIGGSRTITSQGTNNNVFRKLEIVQSLNGETVQFFFGAQIGNGGLTMGQSSTIDGNVFSNGSIVAGGGGNQLITGDVVIAQNGNRIEGINVNDPTGTANNDVHVHSCKNSTITGTLYYVFGGSLNNCSAGGGIQVLPTQIDPQPLPISSSQITNWKNTAQTGGVYTGNYTLSETATATLGPLKIEGNLTLNNSSVLTLTGTLWVTGNLNLNNSSIIQLDNAAYGATSGLMVADGIIDLDNSVTVRGTNQTGSYLMLLTTEGLANPAMSVKNSAMAGVFYASNGFIDISNNVSLREVTGYGLTLGNSVVVQYDVGMANMFFSSGPSGGYKIENWREIP